MPDFQDNPVLSVCSSTDAPAVQGEGFQVDPGTVMVIDDEGAFGVHWLMPGE